MDVSQNTWQNRERKKKTLGQVPEKLPYKEKKEKEKPDNDHAKEWLGIDRK